MAWTRALLRACFVKLSTTVEVEGVEEGVEDDWIELNQDVGPDKVGLVKTIFQ